MPGPHALGLNGGQRRAPVGPDAGEPSPEQTIQLSQLSTPSLRAPKHTNLVPEG
jgi:hypothetical protein